MNPPQRFGLLLPLFYLFALISPGQAWANCVSHPTDPGAQFLGSFVVSVPVYISPASTACSTHIEICVWQRSDSKIDYVLNIGSMNFTGTCGVVDLMSLPSILDLLAAGTVKRGTELGYTECGDTTDVLVGQCAERSGSGAETTFEPCNTLWCKRRYVVVCGPLGTIYQQLLEDPAVCSGASSGCEQGCSTQ